MLLVQKTSPHNHNSNNIQAIMKLLIIATGLGIGVQLWFFGWGVIINIIWCSLVALMSESIILRLRKKNILFYLKDGSAFVTALLLAIAIPPFSPWWMSLVGVAFAIIFGKQLYGGLGHNIFNPAMIGYVFLLISFPQQMTFWLIPYGLEGHSSSLQSAFYTIFSISTAPDSLSMATFLDSIRANNQLNFKQVSTSIFNNPSQTAWFWVNFSYLTGGLYLLYKKSFSWHAPVGMIGTLAVMAIVFFNHTHVSPIAHLFSGGTMLGAFFIITDPVSGATSKQGRFIFGCLTGMLTYIIRTWGGFPDGIAFATLIMNMAAPTIDYYTTPKTYGYKKRNTGLPKSE